jgi:hypothetical protein
MVQHARPRRPRLTTLRRHQQPSDIYQVVSSSSIRTSPRRATEATRRNSRAGELAVGALDLQGLPVRHLLELLARSADAVGVVGLLVAVGAGDLVARRAARDSRECDTGPSRFARGGGGDGISVRCGCGRPLPLRCSPPPVVPRTIRSSKQGPPARGRAAGRWVRSDRPAQEAGAGSAAASRPRQTRERVGGRPTGRGSSTAGRRIRRAIACSVAPAGRRRTAPLTFGGYRVPDKRACGRFPTASCGVGDAAFQIEGATRRRPGESILGIASAARRARSRTAPTATSPATTTPLVARTWR